MTKDSTWKIKKLLWKTIHFILPSISPHIQTTIFVWLCTMSFSTSLGTHFLSLERCLLPFLKECNVLLKFSMVQCFDLLKFVSAATSLGISIYIL